MKSKSHHGHAVVVVHLMMLNSQSMRSKIMLRADRMIGNLINKAKQTELHTRHRLLCSVLFL